MLIRRHLLLLYCQLLTTVLFGQTTPKAFNEATDAFMKAHVDGGRVDYSRLSKSGADLSALYKQAGATNLAGASDAEKKAFYINAYNVAVIHDVVQHFPLKSPLDQPGFFDKTKHRIAGQEMTLNQLEKDRLLNTYGDARIHFVVVCAAVSCPPLASFAYMPDKLDAQLDERTRLALNDPTFIQVNRGQKKVNVSKIFDWYKSDFTKGGQSILGYVNGFRREKIPNDYALGFYEYNWNLNGR
ncbi:hypothetical protein BN8_02803 [Fibrisoma limi BUZ 3]|uniref:DUF547 domain-containing protein n=1 Tax=Fibrisoma limi BUZ 3 TaxID=1185876 RepID=I2GIG4_9BACT|nr:DUF547 domain-containing protein [Fibrisoma limi]CCH53689.1 hypothetical protein BN8_02803 [Fibrisoma limi BUZ 3]